MASENGTGKPKPPKVDDRPTVTAADASSKPVSKGDAVGGVSPATSSSHDVADFIRKMQELPK